MRNLIHRWLQSGHFRQFSRIRRGDLRSPPSSYALLVIRNCRILLLTKFTLIKLKTDFFSLSMHCVGSYQLLLSQTSLCIQSTSIIKKSYKTAFSTWFRIMKLKADACSFFLMLISINQQLLTFSALYIQTCVKSVKQLTR